MSAASNDPDQPSASARLAAAEVSAQPDLPMGPSGPHLHAAALVKLAHVYGRAQARPWDLGQGPHPQGGYSHRSATATAPAQRFTIRHTDERGRRHRADGPATITYQADPGARVFVPIGVRHQLADLTHRDDGPAIAENGQARFCLRHTELGPAWLEREELAALFVTLLAAGHHRRQAVAWLETCAALGASRVLQLARAGADPALAQGAIAAGITSSGALTQVAAGVLPLSWAIAGLAR